MGLNKTLATGKFKYDGTSLWGDQGYFDKLSHQRGQWPWSQISLIQKVLPDPPLISLPGHLPGCSLRNAGQQYR